jgi:mono/diheme cytochrome c family protein
MRTWIRRSLTGAAALVAVASAAVGIAVEMGERKRERQIEFAVAPVPFQSAATSVEHGGYLFRSRGCADCHGGNGGGAIVIDDGGLLVRSPDITPGPDHVVAGYAPVDWVRTIRHGVKPDGRPLLIMPSEDYNRLTDADVAAIVAYARQLPSASGQRAIVQLSLPVKVLYGLGLVRDAAETIDHTLAPAQPVAAGVTAAHGAYVANGCIGCHRAGLVGGKIAGAPPSWPAAARLAPGPDIVMPRYRDVRAFAAMLKSGKRPDGSAVSEVMPFSSLRELNDLDVQALYLYLTTLPAGTS